MRLRHGTSEAPLRLAVLASGSGSGMEALVRYQQAKESLHTTVVVVTDKANAGAIERATALGCAVEVVPLPNVEDRVARRSAHEDLIQSTLESYDVEVIVLSGWMRLLTAAFVERWKGRLVNIHPSLLPDFLARMPTATSSRQERPKVDARFTSWTRGWTLDRSSPKRPFLCSGTTHRTFGRTGEGRGASLVPTRARCAGVRNHLV